VSSEEKPRLKPVIEGAESLSLGISMVVAVLIGVGLGFLLRSMTGAGWTLWIGVFIGIAAAFLNVFKAYSKQYKEFEKLAQDPRYAIKKQLDDDMDEVDSDGVDKSH
jgi:F0F1-type ATP synthase assembly protein I